MSFSVSAQTENDEPLLGLPGDDLDLYAVLDVFQKSKTIEDFEKSLNDPDAGLVNLDLNNDGKVDFIKVVTEQEGDNFMFILQDDISEKETQDVAVIFVTKDDSGKVSMQVVGDEALYGKDYVVEPRSTPTDSVTANPGYTGEEPVTVNVQANTEVVVVESTPVVQYVYSTTYVPYYPTYYYGYYPHWWRPVAVIGIGIYRHNHWHRHHHYHGGRYGHTNVNININNSKHYNNYNKNKRNTSNKVNNNIKNGNFKTANQGGSRPSTSQSRNNASNRASTSNRASSTNRSSSANRASTNPSTSRSNQSSKASSSNRSTSPSSANKSSGSRGSSYSGGNRSYGGRSTGGHSGGSRGGAARGGGGRRR